MQEEQPRAFESEVVMNRADYEAVFTEQSHGLRHFHWQKRKLDFYVNASISAHFKVEFARRTDFWWNES